MNKDRRKSIDEAIGLLQEAEAKVDEAKSLIETARDEEQEYFDNMPESLQGGDKGQAAEAAVSALEEALSPLEDLDFADIVGNLETAKEG